MKRKNATIEKKRIDLDNQTCEKPKRNIEEQEMMHSFNLFAHNFLCYYYKRQRQNLQSFQEKASFENVKEETNDF